MLKTIDPVALSALDHPVNMFVFQGPVVWWFFTFLGFFIAQTYYKKSFSYLALVFIAFTTAFWQEFVSDWGAGLLYSPQFALMPWHAEFTTPNKPWFMPAAYGWWNTLITPPILWACKWLHGKLPNLNRVIVVSIVALPFFGLFDLVNEGPSVANGWWTYLEPIGPAFTAANGAVIPLIYPAFLPYAVMAIVYYSLLFTTGPDGRQRFEDWFDIGRMAAGWRRETRRVFVWIFVINAVYFLFLTLPCIAIRLWVTGPVTFPG